MKEILIVTAGFLLWAVVPHQSVRADEQHEASHAWYNGARISGGLQVRRWEANFRPTRLTAPPARGMRQSDIGYHGLYPGEGDIHYIDGSILAASDYIEGVAHFTVSHEGQIGSAPHLDGFDGSSRTITFSSVYAEGPQTIYEELHSAGSNEETVLMPFVLLEWPLLVSDEDGWSLYGALRYAFGRGTIDRGTRPFSRTIHQQRVVHNLYTYDATYFSGEITAPFDARDHGSQAGLIYDPNAAVGQAYQHPWNDPVQQSIQNIQRQTYTGLSAHEIDIEQHEILLGGSAERPVADRLSVGVLAGVTLSYVDWTFNTDAWFVNDAGRTVAQQRFSRSGSEWLWGATCQVQARLTVTEDGLYFALLDVGYNWVDDFSSGNDASSVRVELGSWGISGAVGRRL